MDCVCVPFRGWMGKTKYLNAFKRGMVVCARHTGLCQELQCCWVFHAQQFPMCIKYGLRTDATRFNTGRSRSVSLYGLPLRSWGKVAPTRFHFTMAALTVDRGSSSRAEIWGTDLLERCHPMMVPHWMSRSSSVRPFYCQCLSMAITWLCAQFYTPESNGVAEIAESTNLKVTNLKI